jgi:hypothetical protein
VQELGLELPPTRAWLGTRPLKRWRYVGVYGPELMLCVGEAVVAGVPQRWWAAALPDGSLYGRTTHRRRGVHLAPGRARVHARGVAIWLDFEETEGVEVVSRSGSSYIWTRKQAGIPVRGVVQLPSRQSQIDGEAFVDDSAGYHERHTVWKWSAGLGRGAGGERLAWNLVDGVHDSTESSERTVWVDGEPREVGPVAFAPNLSSVGGLRFTEWATRVDRTNRLVFRSSYRQPFGAFAGTLPGGIQLAEGWGVMEEHDAWW